MDESAAADHLIGLKRRAEAGDDGALEDLLTRLYAPVARFLRRRFGGDPYAEGWIDDLVQETLLRVLRFLGDCSATSNAQLMAWVLAISRRVAIDWLRSSNPGKEKTSTEGGTLAGAFPEEWDLLADRGNPVLTEMLLPAVIAVHDELPEPTQRLLWLRVIEDASWPEVGKAMQTTPSGAKRRWQRAEKRLRREIIRRINGLPEGDRVPLTATLRRLGIEL